MKQPKENRKNENYKKAVAQHQKQLPFDLSHFGYLFIIALITIVYYQTITFDFTNFEDDYLISNNINNLSNIHNLDDIFFKNSFLSEYNLGFYRPLQTFTYMIDALIGGANPAIFHITNIIIHILTCCFIFLLFKKLKYSGNISLFIALIYSVHPLFVHAVVWLPSRGDLLLTLFSVLSFIFLIRFNESKKVSDLLLNAFFFLLAVLSKETAMLLPILFFIWLFILKKNEITSKNGILIISSWIIINAFAYIMRLLTVENVLNKEDFGINPFINNLATIPEVIGKFILPINIQVMPNFNLINTSIGIFIIITLLISFIIQIKSSVVVKNNHSENIINYRQLLFGLIWFLILIIPGMFYGRKFTDSDHLFDYQDHRNYLTMIGIVIVLLEIIPFYLKKINSKQLIIISSTLILILSTITFVNSKQYTAPIIFFSSAIKDNPTISGLYFIRAGIYKDKGNFDAALIDYTNTIRLNSQHADAYNNRASIRALQGNYSMALKDLNHAIKLKPDIIESYYNRAVVKSSLGDIQGAIEDYSNVLSKNKNDFTSLSERAQLLMSVNDFNNAINDLNKVIKLHKDNYYTYFNRGIAYLKLQDYNKAINDFNETIKFNPKYSNAYLNLGIAYHRSGRLKLACQNWQKAYNFGNKSALSLIQTNCK